MRYLIVALMILMGCGAAHAADWSWTASDYIAEVACEAVTVIDWGQTNDIRNHEGMIELNPMLGRTPTRRAVRNYFAGVLAVHPLVSAALPRQATLFGMDLNPRKAWQYFYLGVEATATVSNCRGGLSLSF